MIFTTALSACALESKDLAAPEAVEFFSGMGLESRRSAGQDDGARLARLDRRFARPRRSRGAHFASARSAIVHTLRVCASATCTARSARIPRPVHPRMRVATTPSKWASATRTWTSRSELSLPRRRRRTDLVCQGASSLQPNGMHAAEKQLTAGLLVCSARLCGAAASPKRRSSRPPSNLARAAGRLQLRFQHLTITASRTLGDAQLRAVGVL